MNVASLAALKPAPAKRSHLPAKADLAGLMQELHKIKSDFGGHSHVMERSSGEVSRNGQLVESVSRSVDSRREPGEAPRSSSVTEIEVPSLGIHERQVSGTPEHNREAEADPETAAKLAGYVLDTGDQASVVQFLQLLLQEGKLSKEQALMYVESIKKDIEDAESRAREGKMGEQEPREEVDRIRKLVEADEREKEERSAAMMEKARTLKAVSSLEREEEEHDLILKINDYLEGSLSEGKISKNLYDHLKEALIESVVEGMRADITSLNTDYSHY